MGMTLLPKQLRITDVTDVRGPCFVCSRDFFWGKLGELDASGETGYAQKHGYICMTCGDKGHTKESSYNDRQGRLWR